MVIDTIFLQFIICFVIWYNFTFFLKQNNWAVASNFIGQICQIEAYFVRKFKTLNMLEATLRLSLHCWQYIVNREWERYINGILSWGLVSTLVSNFLSWVIVNQVPSPHVNGDMRMMLFRCSQITSWKVPYRWVL